MHLSQLNTSTIINSLQTVSSAFLLSKANYSYQQFDVTYGHCRVQKRHVQFCWLCTPFLFQIHNLQAVAKESQVQVVIDAIHISRLFLKKDVYFLQIQGNCPETLSVFQSLRLSFKRPLGGTTSCCAQSDCRHKEVMFASIYKQHRQQSLKFICWYWSFATIVTRLAWNSNGRESVKQGFSWFHFS